MLAVLLLAAQLESAGPVPAEQIQTAPPTADGARCDAEQTAPRGTDGADAPQQTSGSNEDKKPPTPPHTGVRALLTWTMLPAAGPGSAGVFVTRVPQP